MRLVTSWRIAVRSASFWSTSIFWFWTSCAAATAASWSASTWRSSRRDSRASRCASFSERRSWSAIACCSERMVSMSARLWMLEMMSNQSRSPVLYMVAARLARIPRCASSASSALFRSMRERTRRWFTASSFACASTSFCPTLCSSLCRFAISARVRLASFCRVEEGGSGRRSRSGRGGQDERHQEEGEQGRAGRREARPHRVTGVRAGDGCLSDHVAALRAHCSGYRPGWALLDRWTGRHRGAGLCEDLRAGCAKPSHPRVAVRPQRRHRGARSACAGPPRRRQRRHNGVALGRKNPGVDTGLDRDETQKSVSRGRPGYPCFACQPRGRHRRSLVPPARAGAADAEAGGAA